MSGPVAVLRAYRDEDLALALALETDPVVMAELGGPRPAAAVRDVHRQRLETPWWLTIADPRSGEPLGSIGVWETEHDGEAIHETGWTVLPAAQGRGVASAALRELIDRVEEARLATALHAFPGVTNVASNRLCDRFGFERRDETAVEFAGRELRCVHRVLVLRP